MSWFQKLTIGLVAFVILALAGLQISASFLLKPILERQGREIFKVPVSVERAGISVVHNSIWVKGLRIRNERTFQHQNFVVASKLVIQFNLISLLTNQFVVKQIRLDDPRIVIETNQAGKNNLHVFLNRTISRFQKFTRTKPSYLHWINHYELEKFSLRGGKIIVGNPMDMDQEWQFHPVTLSLTRIMYPPDPGELLPMQVYLNANVQGQRRGQILILGKINPFPAKKNFELTASFSDILLSEYSVLFTHFPLEFADGILQLKVKAVCQNNLVDVRHEVDLNHIQFKNKAVIPKTRSLAFGLPAVQVEDFFNHVLAGKDRFSFQYRVVGNLSDPEFDLFEESKSKLNRAMKYHIEQEMKQLEQKAQTVTGTGWLNMLNVNPAKKS